MILYWVTRMDPRTRVASAKPGGTSLGFSDVAQWSGKSKLVFVAPSRGATSNPKSDASLASIADVVMTVLHSDGVPGCSRPSPSGAQSGHRLCDPDSPPSVLSDAEGPGPDSEPLALGASLQPAEESSRAETRSCAGAGRIGLFSMRPAFHLRDTTVNTWTARRGAGTTPPSAIRATLYEPVRCVTTRNHSRRATAASLLRGAIVDHFMAVFARARGAQERDACWTHGSRRCTAWAVSAARFARGGSDAACESSCPGDATSLKRRVPQCGSALRPRWMGGGYVRRVSG